MTAPSPNHNRNRRSQERSKRICPFTVGILTVSVCWGLPASRLLAETEGILQWIKEDTVATDYLWEAQELEKIVSSDDKAAAIRFVLEGKTVPLKKGTKVQVMDDGWGTSLEKVRPFGSTDSLWVQKECTSRSPVEPDAEATPSPSPALVQAKPPWEPPSTPKPTPIPATTLSTPKGSNGDITGIKLFLNQEPAFWIKYYGNAGDQNPDGLDYIWYIGRFQLRVGFDRDSRKADSVNLSAQPYKQVLTLDEAKKLMASLGLKTFRPYYDGGNFGTWENPNQTIHAIYLSDHVLGIQTPLFYNNGVVSE
jgi:hypothetical protein